MKIKEIKLYGFKSFYGETKLLLNRGITAFVGPNGSGKSNIFDALRWVFGEQSMKALRCEKNEDLIHISPEGENLNFTEVSVTIENEDFFPQFGSEFEIRRRFYRDGESEFYLNRVRCRLQDIQALFLNSGTLTYSFLELAEVEKIIAGETKEMFDDVAGVLKYQERREQTLRRLQQTEQDLLRLEDVILELERSLRVLKRQARQAQLYKDLNEEYKIVSLYLLKTKDNKTAEAIKELQNKIDELQTKKQTILIEIKDLEDKRLDLKNRISQTESIKKETLSQISNINYEIENLQNELNSKESEVRALTIEKERHAISVQEKQQTLESFKIKIEELKSSLKNTEDELKDSEAEMANKKAELEKYSLEFAEITRAIKEREKVINDKLRDIQTLKNEIAKYEINRMNREEILNRIKLEGETLLKNRESYSIEKRKIEEEIEGIIGEQNQLSGELLKKQEELKNTEKELLEVEDNLRLKQEELNTIRIMVDILTQRIGEPEGIKEIKEKLGNKITGLFREYLEVLPGYEPVVDICLGEILNYYVLEEVNITDLTNLPEAKIGFAINRVSSNSNLPEELKGLKSLNQCVKIKGEKLFINRYLSNYFIVDDIHQAYLLSENYSNFGFALNDGILFHNGNILVQKGEFGYFKINQKLNEGKKKLELLQNEIIFMNDEKRRLLGEIEKTETMIEEYRDKLFPINVKKSELNLHLNELEKRINENLSEEEELNNEAKKIDEEIRNIERDIHSHQNRLKETEEAIRLIEEEKENLKIQIQEIDEKINRCNTELNEIVLKNGILKERKTSIEELLKKTESEMEDLNREIIKEASPLATERLTELQQTIESLKNKITEKKQYRITLESQIPEKEIEELNKNLDIIYEELTQKRKIQEDIQNEIMQINYELFQSNRDREELQKKAREEFQTELSLYIPEEIPDAESKLNEIKDRMAKLGVINPLSFEVYEQEKKRLDEFLAQRNDIIAAKQNLLKSIEELDTRAKERFILTFNEIKEKFNSVFSNFFEGGEADLILSDPENPLISQVDIVVRMKGKRVKMINQLSGGERTLLAVSLLLALYLVKPAPFCILDEIDAPLDDANVVRFNKFLRDLSQHTQVIIITHNRTTMEYADYIYGLTMEKPGQSKVVSARLADLEKIE
uniref:Chromosome partition protein Smc n=1 Tax=candidate division WOR-3 bacterium TaxID=2052148 RepID=A0A7C4TII5_UNCW3